MLLKVADDKSKRISLLSELQRASILDARQRKWAREELVRLRRGIQGETESAYFLDQYFRGAENHVLLHDLRFVVDGDVAQIDHLVINRGVGMYLIETKNYSGNVSINEQGEFTAEYSSECFGVPSPLEQSHRHARILQRLLQRLGIVGRTGAPLDCYHVVMFHPKAIIRRASPDKFDSSNVIKADQFPSWHQQFVDKEFGVSKLLRMTLNIRSLETIREWGEMLKRQHRAMNLLELPEFMTPLRELTTPASASVPATLAIKSVEGNSLQTPGAPPTSTPVPAARKLVCLNCNAKISFSEGKFCWNNSGRFGGGQYCREHQALY